MSNWQKVRLGEVCSYENRRMDISQLTTKTYISTENMQPNKGRVLESSALPVSGGVVQFSKGQTLISNIRPYFKKIWKAEFDGGCSNDVLCFKLTDCVNSQYFYYLLGQDLFFDYVMAGSKGTKMPRGDKGQIMQFEFMLPPLAEQERIAGILGALDDKIECNNRINRNLEEQAQALFRRWFVDFEFPDPNNAGKPYRSSGGIFLDSELGEIPQGWRVGKLEDIGTVVGGGTPSKAKDEYFTSNGIAWITPKDLSVCKNKFISKGEIDITDNGYNNSSTKLMPRGTVLFSSRAPIGYIAISQNEISTNQGFKSVIPNSSIGTPFVYYFLQFNTELIESKSSGSTFKEASGGLMKSLDIVIPDANILNMFSGLCNDFFTQQEKLEQQNQTLVQLRDTLLPKLMNNEI